MSAAGADGLLAIRALSKRFEGTLALDSVDLDIRRGEIHALVGQNGSGKSTLIKILAGFHEPEPASAITIDGAPVSFRCPSDALAAGLRFVHQDLGLVHSMNTVENLALGFGFDTTAVGRIKWRKDRQRAAERLHELGYDVDVRRPVSELAAAQRTGIAIARALSDWEQARVLVVDEPTAVLPRAEVQFLFEAVSRVRDRGLGVLYVSHRLDEVFALADRVTVLRDGRRVGTYPVDELDERRLVELMIGEESLLAVADTPAAAGTEGTLSVEDLTGKLVNEVSFRASRGEVVGIAGLTGSGREEILRLIFGAYRASSGTIRVEGTALDTASPRAAMGAGLAFVPGDRHALGSIISLNVRENLTLTDLPRHTGRCGVLRRRSERSEVNRWINALEIHPADAEAPFVSLSGGNQQKVVMAKWLRMNPKVLLLDEPTQGVDVHAKEIIHRMARDAARSGSAVVIASSDDAELCDTCDRVLVLRDGRVSAELQGEMLTEHELGRLQLGSSGIR